MYIFYRFILQTLLTKDELDTILANIERNEFYADFVVDLFAFVAVFAAKHLS